MTFPRNFKQSASFFVSLSRSKMFVRCATSRLKNVVFIYSLQATSEEEEEEVFDSSKESVELYCVHAREKLTNSIRLQWRRLKSHVERLDSQGKIL